MHPEIAYRAQKWAVLGVVLGVSLLIALALVVQPLLAFGATTLLAATVFALCVRRSWQYALWIALFGLAVWSYGFNNVPLIRPLPLVDVLVVYAAILSFPLWGRLHRVALVRRLLFLTGALAVVLAFRLVLDVPRFGLIAVRDALFGLELWVLFPAIALGYSLGKKRLNRRFFWLFILASAWFLLYPLRGQLASISPVVGIQRPVPLFAFTTAGFLAVPMFFWLLWHKPFSLGLIGAGAALLILLFVQSRGAYLAFLLSVVAAFMLHPGRLSRWMRLAGAGIVVAAGLSLIGTIPGRVGEPIGLQAVVEQLQTLLGEEGPGAGSFEHRLRAWPVVVTQVLADPLAPIIGLGLGLDLFQGFAVEGGVLVRKPHNDFLEIWARTGLFGLLPWIGLLITTGIAAFRGARKSPGEMWILALQITLWITSFTQPAFGFAYITVVWATLTGLWMGAHLRERGLASHQIGCSISNDGNSVCTQPLPAARR